MPSTSSPIELGPDGRGLSILGAGGHGKVVLDAAWAAGWRVVGVHDEFPARGELLGVRVLAMAEVWLEAGLSTPWVVAVGRNAVRRRLYGRLRGMGALGAIVVHPRAVVAASAEIGPGSVVLAGAVVNPGVVMGENCIVNTGATVDHDCRIGAHVHLCPGVHLAGDVQVGEETMLGTGVSVIPGIRIGRGCLIGAGAVVVRDIPDGAVAYGVPARVQPPSAVRNVGSPG